MTDSAQLKNIIEGLLFASSKPMSSKQIANMFEGNDAPAPGEIKEALNALEEDYKNRGVQLLKVASGYCFRVHDDLGSIVSKLWEEKPTRYSRAFLETLAIIAYRQPITRGEIESIRGVAVSSNIVKTLQERDWIRVVGHKDVPGRPALLATTKDFLNHFNLKKLEDLPPLSEIRDLDEVAAALDQQAANDDEQVLDESTEETTEEIVLVAPHKEEDDEDTTAEV